MRMLEYLICITYKHTYSEVVKPSHNAYVPFCLHTFSPEVQSRPLSPRRRRLPAHPCPSEMRAWETATQPQGPPRLLRPYESHTRTLNTRKQSQFERKRESECGLLKRSAQASASCASGCRCTSPGTRARRHACMLRPWKTPSVLTWEVPRCLRSFLIISC